MPQTSPLIRPRRGASGGLPSLLGSAACATGSAQKKARCNSSGKPRGAVSAALTRHCFSECVAAHDSEWRPHGWDGPKSGTTGELRLARCQSILLLVQRGSPTFSTAVAWCDCPSGNGHRLVTLGAPTRLADDGCSSSKGRRPVTVTLGQPKLQPEDGHGPPAMLHVPGTHAGRQSPALWGRCGLCHHGVCLSPARERPHRSVSGHSRSREEELRPPAHMTRVAKRHGIKRGHASHFWCPGQSTCGRCVAGQVTERADAQGAAYATGRAATGRA